MRPIIKKIKHYANAVYRRFRLVPLQYRVITGISLLLLVFLAFLWPQRVVLSYGQPTCLRQPLLVPNVLHTETTEFTTILLDPVKIGNIPISSGGICFVARTSPQIGERQVVLRFFNLPLIGKRVVVTVPEPPKASLSVFQKSLPVSKQLMIPMSGQDRIYSYRLAEGSRYVDCRNTGSTINCDLPKLELQQGLKYTLELQRVFKNKKVAVIAKQPVSMLSAVSYQSATIKPGETVYSRPTSIAAVFDKPLASVKARLLQLADKAEQGIAVKAVVTDKQVVITWPAELQRQKSYKLVFAQVEATDGSTLIDPIEIPFSTSGGPIVKSVSVSTYKVPLGSVATITFDQSLSDKQDITTVVTATGGAKVAGKAGNQVRVSFAAVPRCSDVTIKVTDGLQSSYEVSGGSAWQYNTRTICQAVSSIGTSVKGRAITSYTLGSGPQVVLFTGAIHGSEASTRSLMMRWIDELEARPRQIPADKSVVIVPTINPDGLASGSRVNANNVDLNRNFATSDWKTDITTTSNTPFPGGGGASAMSEPETKAIANLVGRLKPRLVLSYHSIGGLVAANQTGDSSSRAGTYAKLSGYRNTTGSSDTFEYGISGTADDYYGQVLAVPSILVELGSHSYHQFDRNQAAMWAMVR